MSIQLSIYVGPYLKCVRRKGSSRIDLPDRLRDLIGECDTLPNCDIVGPNLDIYGVDRQLEFCKLVENVVTPIDSIVREMALFETQFAHDINEIRGDYESIEVRWGVVPGWF